MWSHAAVLLATEGTTARICPFLPCRFPFLLGKKKRNCRRPGNQSGLSRRAWRQLVPWWQVEARVRRRPRRRGGIAGRRWPQRGGRGGRPRPLALVPGIGTADAARRARPLELRAGHRAVDGARRPRSPALQPARSAHRELAAGQHRLLAPQMGRAGPWAGLGRGALRYARPLLPVPRLDAVAGPIRRRRRPVSSVCLSSSGKRSLSSSHLLGTGPPCARR